MSNGPDRKVLPADKADRLADDIGKKFHDFYKSSKEDLVKHEVSKKQAADIVRKGLEKGAKKIFDSEREDA